MGTKLTIKEGLKLAAARAKKSIAQISKEMGFKNRANLNNMICRGSMRASTFIEVAELCGYSVKLVNEAGDEIEIKVDAKEVENE